MSRKFGNNKTDTASAAYGDGFSPKPDRSRIQNYTENFYSPDEDRQYLPDNYDDPDSEPPEPKGGAAMKIAVTAAVLITLAVAVFFAYIFFFSDSGSNSRKTSPAAPATTDATAPSETASAQPVTNNEISKMVTMPDLSGLSEDEAYKALNSAGVKYKVTREFSETTALNHVISQTPEAYYEIPSNQTAVIYISKGKENEIIYATTNPPAKKDKEKETKPAQSSPNTANDDYLLPDSDTRRLSQSDLTSFDRDTLNLALNEIYARHGRIFNSAEIREYFTSKSWYKGTVSPGNFNDNVLNEYERYNIALISEYQSSLGYR